MPICLRKRMKGVHRKSDTSSRTGLSRFILTQGPYVMDHTELPNQCLRRE